MNIIYDYTQLANLFGDLYRFTGVRCNVVDPKGKPAFMSGPQSDFCELINSYPEWHKKCSQCDASAVHIVQETRNTYTYRCYAGIFETVVPIIENGEILAHVFFGQILDNTSIEDQWKKTAALVAGFPDVSGLKEAFFRLRNLSIQDINALTNILRACTSYILLQEMIKTVSLSDVQKVEVYLSQNYTRNITLDTMSRELGICKTKLCSIASEIEPGGTINHLVAHKRMQQAKILLRNSEMTISEVSEAVGLSNYNYFSRIFKKYYGLTPREYRNGKDR